jgi:hypothetical protein
MGYVIVQQPGSLLLGQLYITWPSEWQLLFEFTEEYSHYV